MSKLNLDLSWIKECVANLNQIFLAMKNRNASKYYSNPRKTFPEKRFPQSEFILVIEDLQRLVTINVLEDVMARIDKDLTVDPKVLHQELVIVRAYFWGEHVKKHPEIFKLPETFEELMGTDVQFSSIMK